MVATGTGEAVAGQEEAAGASEGGAGATRGDPEVGGRGCSGTRDGENVL